MASKHVWTCRQAKPRFVLTKTVNANSSHRRSNRSRSVAVVLPTWIIIKCVHFFMMCLRIPDIIESNGVRVNPEPLQSLNIKSIWYVIHGLSRLNKHCLYSTVYSHPKGEGGSSPPPVAAAIISRSDPVARWIINWHVRGTPISAFDPCYSYNIAPPPLTLICLLFSYIDTHSLVCVIFTSLD